MTVSQSSPAGRLRAVLERVAGVTADGAALLAAGLSAHRRPDRLTYFTAAPARCPSEPRRVLLCRHDLGRGGRRPGAGRLTASTGPGGPGQPAPSPLSGHVASPHRRPLHW